MVDERRGPTRMVRAALFGAGKMAKHHAMAIRMQGNAILAAVADPALAGGEPPEWAGGGADVYSNAEELLVRSKPDVVHVCTPPETHVPLANLALMHGAHVYVEKPFALDVAGAKEVLSFAEERGLRVCAGHQLLFESPSLQADAFSKKLGRIVHVESYFSFKTVRRARTGSAAIPPLEQLVDILPHPVYLLLHYLAGDPPQPGTKIEVRSLEVMSTGSVHGILRCGERTGILTVTLEGRPIESYVRLVGTNGCLHADFVRGTVITHPGPGISSIAKVLHPYQQSWQTVSKSTGALFRRVFGKQKSYPGLVEIIGSFYRSFPAGAAPAIRPDAILETVAICEEAGRKLRTAERDANEAAGKELARLESVLPPPDRSRGGVLITGGTGMLGKAVAREVRRTNRYTRVVARTLPPAATRIPGVAYETADLAGQISPDLLEGISVVIHCAAETAGGMEAHKRNSVGATRNLVEAMHAAGVNDLVHISSVAVLKTGGGTGNPVREDAPLALGEADRGPYVWGKAESERIAKEECAMRGIRIRVIRPGPLMDYNDFEPPGRLGREVGPYFVMVGSKRDKLSLCTVETAAEVIRHYADHFESMPPLLNLLEPDAPTRGELVARLLRGRPDLNAIRIPSGFLRVISPPMKWLQRLLRPGVKPLDIYAAFSGETYDTGLAASLIQAAKSSSPPTMADMA
jgi:predicted dehydrogenase/nucleoside-diphosphate-sugar epimerase